jgi:hypothetical protein
MARKKRSGFGDVSIERARFDRGEAKCPSCNRPIGPQDNPSFVSSFGKGESRLATLRCGRCQAELTVRFEDPAAPEQA